MFASAHNRSCNLVKPSSKCRVRSHRHIQLKRRCFVVICGKLGQDDEAAVTVVHRVALVYRSFCRRLCAPQINTHTERNRAGTVIEMEQNRPFSREQNHRGEEACSAYWYSLQLILMDTDTLPLRAHTGKREENQRGRGRATGSTSLIVVRKLTQHLLLLSSASHSCLCGHTDCKTFL